MDRPERITLGCRTSQSQRTKSPDTSVPSAERKHDDRPGGACPLRDGDAYPHKPIPSQPRLERPFRTGLSFEPWDALRRQMDTGGLHCSVLIQRRLALFSLAALCVSGLVLPQLRTSVRRAAGRLAGFVRGRRLNRFFAEGHGIDAFIALLDQRVVTPDAQAAHVDIDLGGFVIADDLRNPARTSIVLRPRRFSVFSMQ